jgi:hypothetical protein
MLFQISLFLLAGDEIELDTIDPPAEPPQHLSFRELLDVQPAAA